MNPLTQSKNTTILPVLIALSLACFGLSPQARAVCQEGCLTNANTVLGDDALFSNINGGFNTAIGVEALYSNTTGGANTATGVGALFANTTGDENTAIGFAALQTNTTGIDNTATGTGALFRNTTGIGNTAAFISIARIKAHHMPLTQPNLILIVTDDLDLDPIAYMPQLQSLLVNQGLTFSNAFVTRSLCCPSRASILRGQYPHNHQIQSNSLPDGGFEKFTELGLDSSTIATWLQAAGYRTVLIGKYLNGIRGSPTYVPPRLGRVLWCSD